MNVAADITGKLFFCLLPWFKETTTVAYVCDVIKL